jgi:NitT/TauT family transport system substrate-binding protein
LQRRAKHARNGRSAEVLRRHVVGATLLADRARRKTGSVETATTRQDWEEAMRLRCRMTRWLGSLVLVALALGGQRPAEAGTIRIGVLKFGTVNWELDAIKSNGLDRAEGLELQIVELANTAATTVALQAGDVDVIVTDWLWVTRQRAEGAGFTFVPYSTSVGALVLPPDSTVTTLADLAGKKLGIAGGPVDKGWLVVRAAAAQRHGIDLDEAVEKVFAAPPLLNEEIISGRLDALLTFWNFAAQLEARGFRKLIGVEDAARDLGIETQVPLLGYVFDEAWATTHKDDVLALVRASRKAKELLARSDAEWKRLRPLMKAADDATFAALRDGFRAGTPGRWGEAERVDARRLFAIMAKLGGAELVGKSSELQPGTFWDAVTY